MTNEYDILDIFQVLDSSWSLSQEFDTMTNRPIFQQHSDFDY